MYMAVYRIQCVFTSSSTLRIKTEDIIEYNSIQKYIYSPIAQKYYVYTFRLTIWQESFIFFMYRYCLYFNCDSKHWNVVAHLHEF
jgi:hypothetical protein